MKKGANSPPSHGRTGQPVATIALSFALCTGFLDITAGLGLAPPGLSSPLATSALLAATLFLFFLLYAGVWFLIGLPLRRLFRLSTAPLATALAFLLAMLLLVPWRIQTTLLTWSVLDSPRLFIWLSLCGLAAVATYLAAHVVSRKSEHGSLAENLAVASALLLLGAPALMWLYQYGPASLSFFPSLLVVSLLSAGTGAVTLFRRKGIRSDWILAAELFLLILTPVVIWGMGKNQPSASIHQAPTPPQIEHVILITIDSLRADALSSYTPRGTSTPRMDQLAEEGILFRNAFSSAPWTLPAVASIMTGLSPWVHLTVEENSRLPDNLTTLAEHLHARGFHTVAFGFNPFLAPRFNLAQGFQDFAYFPRLIGDSAGAQIVQWLVPGFFSPSTDALTTMTIDWLRANHQKSFFLWLHYLDPHFPYAPPVSHRPAGTPPEPLGASFSFPLEAQRGRFIPSVAQRRWIKSLYEAEVRYVDENVGRLLKALKELDLYDGSLIILTSDHGEEFWEHGAFLHGHTMYDELLRVPLLIKLPGLPAKKTVLAPVATQSITPTILDLCCAATMGEAAAAKSLAPLLQSVSEPVRQEPLMAMGSLYFENLEAVILEGKKYIRTVWTKREELYDLARDPAERSPLAAKYPEQAEKARSLLDAHHREAADVRKRYRLTSEAAVELDRKTRELLKSLGYLH